VDGPTPDGTYKIIAQDLIKLADDDRALAPRPSRGILIADLEGSPLPTSATLTPTGIGNIDYPASGYVNIGGKEVCAFTRSGDTLTLTRSLVIPGTTFETEIVDHDAGARVQLCLPYIGDDPADIVRDLFVTYAGIDSSYIDMTAWQTETDTYLQTLYTALITEPTGVNKLVTEIIQQAGLAIWWDALEQTMRLQVLRAVPTTAAEYNENHFLKGSLHTADQPNKRISEVLCYYGLREPLKPIDEDDNYRAALLTPDPTAAEEYNGIVTKKINSRWVPFGGQQVAERLSLIQLGRYRDPPRKLNFDTWRFGEHTPQLGQGYQFGWTENQDETGAQVPAPIQITRLSPLPEKYSVEAEEALFTIYEGTEPGGLNDRTIIIPSNINNVNLRTMHDSIYPEITDDDVGASPPVTLTCIINDGVIVGSSSTGSPAFDVGSWPVGFTPTLIVNGRIQGRGGNGTDGLPPNGPGTTGAPGGTALYTRNNINLEVGTGEIWGGGGGGGMARHGLVGIGCGGGGGAGQLPGQGGSGSTNAGNNGTTEAGGQGGVNADIEGGDGGGPGLAGTDGDMPVSAYSFVSPGGAAGTAIDGDSFVTVTVGPGDIRGPQIN
jgi:hypothetical protein